jgi:hypothetical protein
VTCAPERSEDQRARVEGPSEGRVPWRMRRSLVPASGAYALSRTPTAFPSSASSGHPLSSARHPPREDPRDSQRTDLGPRSDGAPRRAPPSRRPGCLSPPRHAKESVSRRDESLRPSRRLSRSRRPHASRTGDRAFDWALRGHGAVTRVSVTGSRVQTPLKLFGLPRLGLTTQARLRARPTRPSTRTDCLARTGAGRSA